MVKVITIIIIKTFKDLWGTISNKNKRKPFKNA